MCTQGTYYIRGTEGRNAKNYVPPLFFEKAGDNNENEIFKLAKPAFRGLAKLWHVITIAGRYKECYLDRCLPIYHSPCWASHYIHSGKFFSSPEPKAHGEYSIPVDPASVRPSVSPSVRASVRP